MGVKCGCAAERRRFYGFVAFREGKPEYFRAAAVALDEKVLLRE